MTAPTIEVRCSIVPDGWQCTVRVVEEDGSSTHEVGVGQQGPFFPSTLSHPGLADAERLVRETFVFLLEREPRSAILARFDLAEVRRYYPDYPSWIRVRLSGS